MRGSACEHPKKGKRRGRRGGLDSLPALAGEVERWDQHEGHVQMCGTSHGQGTKRIIVFIVFVLSEGLWLVVDKGAAGIIGCAVRFERRWPMNLRRG